MVVTSPQPPPTHSTPLSLLALVGDMAAEGGQVRWSSWKASLLPPPAEETDCFWVSYFGLVGHTYITPSHANEAAGGLLIAGPGLIMEGNQICKWLLPRLIMTINSQGRVSAHLQKAAALLGRLKLDRRDGLWFGLGAPAPDVPLP